MKFFDRIRCFLKKPNKTFTIIIFFLMLFSAAASILTSIFKYTGIISYIIYTAAAIFLSYFIYILIINFSKIKKASLNLIYKNKVLKRGLENYGVRTVWGGIASLIINTAFVIFNITMAVIEHSAWYSAVAVYYFLLTVLKFTVFYKNGKLKNQKPADSIKLLTAQLKNYRICGVFIFIVDIGMSGVITLSVLSRNPVKHSETAAIALAFYTFCRAAFAVTNVIKAKKYNEPFIQSLRNIGLAETVLSIVSLQMTLVATFSNEYSDMAGLNAAVGFTACAFIVGMGLFMIINTSLKINRLNKQ